MMALLRWVVALFMIAAIASCTDPGMPEGTFRPAAGGKFYGGIYRINETGELSSMDPVRINDVTSGHIAANIYDNLVTFDHNLNLRPELADSFTISGSGMQYTYHLRTDVWFHDDPCFPGGQGRKLVASDVVYSLTRICDARTGSKNAGYFLDKVQGAREYYEATAAVVSDGVPALTGVRGFLAVNDSTVRISLTQPFAPFENYPALSSMGIHPREAVDYYGSAFAQHPVGTGPFRFVRWLPDREVVLQRNPRYWRSDEHGNQFPLLEGVRFSFIKDDKLQLLEFKAGNLEESYRIPNEFFGDIVNNQKQPVGDYARFVLLHVPALSTQYYGFLNTDSVFRDARVRQAFNLAVDRRRIMRYVLRGQAAGPAEHGIVPSSMPGYAHDSVHGYRFEPDRARQLLSDAGFPGGVGFPAVTLQLNAGGGRNMQIAEAIQGMLKEHLNVNVRLLQVEFAQHLERIDAGKAPFYRLGWVADYPDPETFLQLWYGKLVPPNGAMSPINSVRYVNPAFDAVFEQAITTTDRAQRMQLYRQAEQIALDDAPMLLILHDEDYRFLQPYVRDYPHNAMDRLQLHGVWFDRSSE